MNGLDAVIAQKPRHQRLIAGLADNEGCAFGDGPAVPGREIVEHDDAFAGIDHIVHHLAADITGSSGDQDRHSVAENSILPPSDFYCGWMCGINEALRTAAAILLNELD